MKKFTVFILVVHQLLRRLHTSFNSRLSKVERASGVSEIGGFADGFESREDHRIQAFTLTNSPPSTISRGGFGLIYCGKWFALNSAQWYLDADKPIRIVNDTTLKLLLGENRLCYG